MVRFFDIIRKQVKRMATADKAKCLRRREGLHQITERFQRVPFKQTTKRPDQAKQEEPFDVQVAADMLLVFIQHLAQQRETSAEEANLGNGNF